MEGFDALTIECFIAVAETKSFTVAARKVHRTQSAISQQVSKLEKHLGKKLFNRGKVLTLTPDGDVLLRYAKRIMVLQHEAIDQIKQPEIQGDIRFGLPEDFASVFLSDVLTEYISLHPRILLNVDCDMTLNLFQRFKNKEFDLVLLKMNKPEDFPNGLNIYSEPLAWIGDNKFFSHDQAIPLVISPTPCVYRTRAIEALESSNIKWRVAFSSHSFAGKIAAVRAGMGVSVLPRNMVPSELEIIANNATVPALRDSHISLLKHEADNPAINNIERFIANKLR